MSTGGMEFQTSWCDVCKADVTTYEVEGMAATFCSECCNVLEESGVRNQITFSEDNKVVGQLVRGSGRAHGLRGHSESRENTIRNAKNRIITIANQLKLENTMKMVESALNMYKYCLEKGLTRGRRGDLLAAGCLYISCRREKSCHMLLDFSNVLKEDIFVVGKSFFTLIDSLELKDLPLVEPWHYVERFAGELDLGAKFNDVCQTAMKLIAGMKRDWIQTGRRPTSICAAAILVSTKINGIERSKTQIAKVMRICEGTLNKRLTEMVNSSVGSMTIKDIENLPTKLSDSTKETRNDAIAPPSFFKKKRKKTEKFKVKKEDNLRIIKNEDEGLKSLKIDETQWKELQQLSQCQDFEDVSADLNLRDKHEKIIQDNLRKENLGLYTTKTEFVDEEIDDDELNQYLINDEEEIENRTKAWDTLNADYVAQVKRRKKERNRTGKKKVRRKRKTSAKPAIVESAAESTTRMLRQRMSQRRIGRIGLTLDIFGEKNNPLDEIIGKKRKRDEDEDEEEEENQIEEPKSDIDALLDFDEDSHENELRDLNEDYYSPKKKKRKKR